MESAPASRPATPVVSTVALWRAGAGDPEHQADVGHQAVIYAEHRGTQAAAHAALRCRAPTSASEVGMACPATAGDAL